MQIVSITSQGQISIPAKMRRELGLNEKEQALVSVENGKVIVKPIKDLLDLRGSLKTNKRPLTNKELHEAFGEYLAKEAIKGTR